MRREKDETSNFQDFIFTGIATCKTCGSHSDWMVFSKKRYVRCTPCDKEARKRRRKTHRITYLLKDARQRAKSRNINFELNREIIEEKLILQKNKCALSGEEFNSENIYCLDRISCDQGYVNNNIQLVSYYVNCMKLDTPQDVFLKMCEKVYKFKMAQAGKKRKERAK